MVHGLPFIENVVLSKAHNILDIICSANVTNNKYP